MDNLDLREELANRVHEQWSDWMKYLFSKGTLYSDGSFILTGPYAKNLQKQMRTDYFDLSEEEKDADRAEADKFLALIREDKWRTLLR